MILLYKDGSRWGINWKPTIIDFATEYMREYNEGMWELQTKLEKAKIDYQLLTPSLKALTGDYPHNFPITDYMRKRGMEIKNPFGEVQTSGDQS